jgi:hypothetical protein
MRKNFEQSQAQGEDDTNNLLKITLNSVDSLIDPEPSQSSYELLTTLLHMLSINQSFKIQKNLHVEQHLSTDVQNAENYDINNTIFALNNGNLHDLLNMLGLDHVSDQLDGIDETNQTQFSKLLRLISSQLQVNNNVGNNNHNGLLSVLPSWLQITSMSIHEKEISNFGNKNRLNSSHFIAQNDQHDDPASNSQPNSLHHLYISTISPTRQSISDPTIQTRQVLTLSLPLLSQSNQNQHDQVGSHNNNPTSVWTSLQYAWTYLHEINTYHNQNTKYLVTHNNTDDISNELDPDSITVANFFKNNQNSLLPQKIAAKIWWEHAYRIEYAMLSYLIHFERVIFGPFSGILRPRITCDNAYSLSTSLISDFLLLFGQMFSLNDQQVDNPPSSSSYSILGPNFDPNLSEKNVLISALLNTILFSPLYKQAGGLSYSYIQPNSTVPPPQPTKGRRTKAQIEAEKIISKNAEISTFLQPAPGPFSPVAALLYTLGFITTPYITLRHITSLLRYLQLKQNQANELNEQRKKPTRGKKATKKVETEINFFQALLSPHNPLLPINPYSTSYLFGEFLPEESDKDWSEYLMVKKNEENFLQFFLNPTFEQVGEKNNGNFSLNQTDQTDPLLNPYCFDYLRSNTILGEGCQRSIHLCGKNNSGSDDVQCSTKSASKNATSTDHSSLKINTYPESIEPLMNDTQFIAFINNTITMEPVSGATVDAAVSSLLGELKNNIYTQHDHENDNKTAKKGSKSTNTDKTDGVNIGNVLGAEYNINNFDNLIDKIYILLVSFQILEKTLSLLFLTPSLTCSMDTTLSTKPLSLLLSKELIGVPFESLPILRWCDLSLSTSFFSKKNHPFFETQPSSILFEPTFDQNGNIDTLSNLSISSTDIDTHGRLSIQSPLYEVAIDLYSFVLEKRKEQNFEDSKVDEKPAKTTTKGSKTVKSAKSLEKKGIFVDSDLENDNDCHDSTKPRNKASKIKKSTNVSNDGDSHCNDDDDDDGDISDDNSDDTVLNGPDGKTVVLTKKQTSTSRYRLPSQCIIKPQRVTRVLSLHHLYSCYDLLKTKQENSYQALIDKNNEKNVEKSKTSSTSTSMVQATPTHWDYQFQSIGVVCDPRQTIYQLDPSNDLPKTQKEFKNYFKNTLHLKGETGKAINLPTLYKAFEHCHMFIYAGHNNGLQYYKSNDVVKMNVLRHKIITLVWLLGCSSVKVDMPHLGQYFANIGNGFGTVGCFGLEGFTTFCEKNGDVLTQNNQNNRNNQNNQNGNNISKLTSIPILNQYLDYYSQYSNYNIRYYLSKTFTPSQNQQNCNFLLSSNVFEPKGTILSYILAGVPCIVGNLWNVLDQDIDKQTKVICEQIYNEKYQKSIEHAENPNNSTNLNNSEQNIPPTSQAQLIKMSPCNHVSIPNMYNVNESQQEMLLPKNVHSVHSCDVSSLIATSRVGCLLPYVNGAAIVIYGAHVRTDKPIKRSK